MLNTDKVKYLMETNFIDGAELAERVGVSRTSIYKLLNGKTQPRGATLKKLCEALNCEPADIVEADN